MIEQDLIPFMLIDDDFAALRAVVGSRIFYGSAPEFEGSSNTRTLYPYITMEGPISNHRPRYNEGGSLRRYTGLRFWVFGNNDTEVTTILRMISLLLGSVQLTTFGNTYVQAFFEEDSWVDSRLTQRGKQEKDPESSEDPPSPGHIDFCVINSDL